MKKKKCIAVWVALMVSALLIVGSYFAGRWAAKQKAITMEEFEANERRPLWVSFNSVPMIELSLEKPSDPELDFSLISIQEEEGEACFQNNETKEIVCVKVGEAFADNGLVLSKIKCEQVLVRRIRSY